MTDTTLQVRRFGPLDALYCELRRSLPQILAAHVREPEEYIRVTYGNHGPADIAWDGDAGEFRWSGGAPAKRLGLIDGLEEVVQNVADFLDAVTT